MTKIALFDFDKTLIDDDSLRLLWKYAFREVPGAHRFFLKHTLPGIHRAARERAFIPLKNRWLQVLPLLGEDGVDSFVQEELPKHIFPDGQREVERLAEQGYRMYLVSASPEPYLKKVRVYFPFHRFMGTLIDENHHLTGKNNRKEEKVRRINQALKEDNIQPDWKNSVAYSDSLSADLPMLSLVGQPYLINSRKKIPGGKNLRWTV